MSEVRLNFLNWRPDQEDAAHDGLNVAQNVIHEPEGYKPVHLGSAGSFATTGSLAASTGTILSIVAKPVGSLDDLFCAWVSSNGNLNVGINGVTATTSSTGYPPAFSSPAGGAVTAFDVCELNQRIFFVARGDNAAGSVISVSGWMDF
jgi:hypothetical protein